MGRVERARGCTVRPRGTWSWVCRDWLEGKMRLGRDKKPAPSAILQDLEPTASHLELF